METAVPNGAITCFCVSRCGCSFRGTQDQELPSMIQYLRGVLDGSQYVDLATHPLDYDEEPLKANAYA
jgi:hypothetical protein